MREDSAGCAAQFFQPNDHRDPSGLYIHSIGAVAPAMTFVVGSGEVVAAKSIGLDVTQIVARCDFGRNATSATFMVWNQGTDTLSYAISTNVDWMSVSPASGTATTEAGLVTVAFQSASLGSGTRTGTVTVADPGATNNPQAIDVVLTVNERGGLGLSTSAVSVRLCTNQTRQVDVHVRNVGGGMVIYSNTSTRAWLSPDPACATVQRETDIVELDINPAGLAVGSYTAQLMIASGDATNSPQDVEILLDVVDEPQIEVRGNGVPIQHYDITPSSADGTYVGETRLYSGTKTQTFSIVNKGSQPLHLTYTPRVVFAGYFAQAFSVARPPDTPIQVQGTGTFDIAFTPVRTGLQGVAVFVVNNAPTNNPFLFAFGGAGRNPYINWVAYHDTMSDPDSAPNISRGRGTNATFALVDFDSGLAMPGRTIHISGGPQTYDNYLAENSGTNTDGYALFHDVVNLQTVEYRHRTNPVHVAFSGLSTDRRYEVAFFVNCAWGISDRTLVSLGDVASYVNIGSAGMGGGTNADLTDADVDIPATNTVNGCVARWRDIVPAGDGGTSFNATLSGVGNYWFVPQAIMLREYFVTNGPPEVDAGTDRTIYLPVSNATLDATIADDCLPSNVLHRLWSVQSGPGTVAFTPSATVEDPVATFSSTGIYVLALTVDDSLLTNSDTVTITANPHVNQAPAVVAGTNRTIYLPTSNVTLNATVTDDDLPPDATTNLLWTKQSGPGTVSFDPSDAVEDPEAAFSATGTYVLVLTADDGLLTNSDTVQITVLPDPNMAPAVDAGTNRTLQLPVSNVVLNATVTDDGLPFGLTNLSWSKESGPGDVLFAPSPAAEDPTVTFSTFGMYVLKLSVDDGRVTNADTVVVAVHGRAHEVTNWVAFHDTASSAATAARVTKGMADGVCFTLTNFNTGAALPGRTIGFTYSTNSTIGGSSGNPTSGTDAYDVFHGLVDFARPIQFRTAGPVRVTFGGLNTNSRYRVTVGVNDNDSYYINTRSLFTLTNVSRYVNTSSRWVGGGNDADPTDEDVDVVRYNTIAGWVARWEDVVPSGGGGTCFDILCDGRGWFLMAMPQAFKIEEFPLPGNLPPTVDAGPDQTNTFGYSGDLNATVSDDGLPDGVTNLQWSKQSGSGIVTFAPSPAVRNPSVSFSTNGIYVLALSADDGSLTNSDTMTFVANGAPRVYAGGWHEVTTNNAVATLDATISDDGLPLGLTNFSWQFVSGPGPVAFAPSMSVLNPTVSIPDPLPGETYTVMLSASDGHAVGSDFASLYVRWPNHILTVVSEHGQVEPAVGEHVYGHNHTMCGGATASEANGTQFVCVGWTMTGHIPEQGTTNAFCFFITNDAVVTWLWSTNVWLACTPAAHGRIDSDETGWYAFGQSIHPWAVPDPYYHFEQWTGELDSMFIYYNPVSLIMNQARSITALFAENLSINGTPEAWLASFGWTNDFSAAETNDADGDGIPTWEEYIAGTTPTDSNSFFWIAGGASVVDTNVVLCWPSESNRMYGVFWTLNLANPFVPLETNIPSVWPENCYTDTTHGADAIIIYRINVSK